MPDKDSEEDKSSIYYNLLEEAVDSYNERWTGIGGNRYETDFTENDEGITVEFFGEKLEGEYFSLKYSFRQGETEGEKAVMFQENFPRIKFENILEDLNSVLRDRLEGSFEVVKSMEDGKRINEYHF